MSKIQKISVDAILDNNLHLPEALRNKESQLSFGAMLYGVASSEKKIDSQFLFDDVSLEDFTHSFFEDFLKTMFKFGYQLQPIKMKEEYIAVSIDTLVNKLLYMNAINLNKAGISKAVIFERAFEGLYNTSNIEKYLRDFLYLPEEIRDFHIQKDLFKLISERSSIKLSVMKAQVYATDYFCHCLVYTGFVLRRSKKQLAFEPMFDTINQARDLRNKNFASMLNLKK